ncbi:MAG: TolC family protein [Candidatus Melainabacteria bacterium]|nr:TolC family protein [Candidatus Melainabacteria bacterium]
MNTRIRFLSALLGAALALSCDCLCLPVYCQEAGDSRQIENKDEQVILRGLENPPEEPTTEKTGVPAKQQDNPPDSGLVPAVRREDYDVINTQAGEFRERFLKGEAIELRLPMPDQLIPLGGKLPPIRLEASYTNPVSLKDCVDYSISNNLAIRISREQATSQKWLFVGALGNFMPNILLNYRQEYLNGSRLIGGVIPVQFRTPNVTTSAGFNFFGFRGGSVLFGALSNLNQFRAAKQQVQGSINDVLLATTRAYYTMVRNEALLEIQTRAVDVSQAQVNLNRQLEKAGTGTRFQVLQSETQLARDQQALLEQEVALRRAAVDLATTLNLNSAVNLLSVESQVKKVRLLEPEVGINRLINLAVENRPELKYREFLRLAARRNIQVAAAPLYPQLNFFGTVTGSGATLTRQYAFTDPSYQTVAVAGPPLQFPIVDEAGRTATFAADNSSLGFGGGGGGGGRGGRVVLPAGQVLQTPQRVSRQIRKSYNIGIQLDWNFAGSGIPDMANIQSARAIARKTLLEANQELIKVIQEVRDSYLTSETAERLIEVATKEVLSSAEQLRLARVRLANGVGTNIDVINAQRDFTSALVNKADAIITFNIAQAQLLRDVGLIGRETLTSGRLVR